MHGIFPHVATSQQLRPVLIIDGREHTINITTAAIVISQKYNNLGSSLFCASVYVSIWTYRYPQCATKGLNVELQMWEVRNSSCDWSWMHPNTVAMDKERKGFWAHFHTPRVCCTKSWPTAKCIHCHLPAQTLWNSILVQGGVQFVLWWWNTFLL